MSDGDGVVGADSMPNATASAAAAALHLATVQRCAAGPPSIDITSDILTENYWLREKLKEIQSDRDRLLCEVANLRLELDMGELKRLPEDLRFV